MIQKRTYNVFHQFFLRLNNHPNFFTSFQDPITYKKFSTECINQGRELFHKVRSLVSNQFQIFVKVAILPLSRSCIFYK